MSTTEISETIKSGASSVASARELLEERGLQAATAAAAALAEKMRAKAAERAAAAAAKAEEKVRKEAEKEAEKARKAAEREAEKARAAAEKEAEKAARKAEREAKKAEKEAAKAALPKRPRGRPKKVVPSAAAETDDDFLSATGDSDGEEAPAAALHVDADAGAAAAADGGFFALREPSPRPTTPMRHIASLQVENAALRARLERAEAALAAIRATLP